MEVHRFEKLWLVLSLLLIVSFVGTITYGSVNEGIRMIDDEGGTIDSADLSGTEFEDPGVRQVGEDEYEVYVVARQFLFEPGTSEPIVVPADSTVTFYVTSPDVTHGFNLAGTNLNTMVIPGQVAELTTEFEETGRYGIVCHEYCGAAHHTMEGELRVVSQSEYEDREANE